MRDWKKHILFHIRGVEETIAGVDYDIFTTVYHMERAVERAMQIISEAVKSLPLELTAKYPEIEWAKIAGIGNILRHEYQRVDPGTMWRVATIELSKLKSLLTACLPSEELLTPPRAPRRRPAAAPARRRRNTH